MRTHPPATFACCLLLSLCAPASAASRYSQEQDAAAAGAYWKGGGNKLLAKVEVGPELSGSGDDPPSCKPASGCGDITRNNWDYGPLRATKATFKLGDMKEWQRPEAEFDIGAAKTTVNKLYRESLGHLYVRSASGGKLKCTGTLVNINNVASEPAMLAALVPSHCAFDAEERCDGNENYEFQTGVYTWGVKAVHHQLDSHHCTSSRRTTRKVHDYALLQLEHSAKACVPDWDKAAFNFHGGPAPCPWAMAIDERAHCVPDKAYAIGRNAANQIVGARVRCGREGSFVRCDNNPVQTLGGPIMTKEFVACGLTVLADVNKKKEDEPITFSPLLDAKFNTIVGRCRTAVRAERARLPKDVETGPSIDSGKVNELLCGGLLSGLTQAAGGGGDGGGLGGIVQGLLCP